ncbi:hypothetical protein GSI_10939 [Ganoderma sinense ZZ0214-1]|uniref:Uncharacterized protein n=1 Tax=Ganoderma sinense ZZ0214-1 TaxID=1077348 RepID=A0A2G8S1Z2_9APHY|nr:hypothetical protein GSI_10939 [Ganoderma sinense ZZ0214-1]
MLSGRFCSSLDTRFERFAHSHWTSASSLVGVPRLKRASSISHPSQVAHGASRIARRTSRTPWHAFPVCIPSPAPRVDRRPWPDRDKGVGRASASAQRPEYAKALRAVRTWYGVSLEVFAVALPSVRTRRRCRAELPLPLSRSADPPQSHAHSSASTRSGEGIAREPKRAGGDVEPTSIQVLMLIIIIAREPPRLLCEFGADSD